MSTVIQRISDWFNRRRAEHADRARPLDDILSDIDIKGFLTHGSWSGDATVLSDAERALITDEHARLDDAGRRTLFSLVTKHFDQFLQMRWTSVLYEREAVKALVALIVMYGTINRLGPEVFLHHQLAARVAGLRYWMVDTIGLPATSVPLWRGMGIAAVTLPTSIPTTDIEHLLWLGDHIDELEPLAEVLCQRADLSRKLCEELLSMPQPLAGGAL